jgi:hypothetical protein
LAEAYASGSLLSDHSPLAQQISALATKISGVEEQEGCQSKQAPWYRKFRTVRG